MGIDIGTTSARAILIDVENGALKSEGVSPYEMFIPKPAWAEQDPAEWVRGVSKAIKIALDNAKARKEDIAAVGLTGQMHSTVFLNANKTVLRRAILWCDGRTSAECGEITRRVGKKILLSIARNIAMPGFTAPKILWLANHEPEKFKKVDKILVTKDYIRYIMTGDFATEVSDASGTLLLDVAKRKWAPEILDALDIPLKWLPEVFESPEVTGRVSKMGALVFGLAEGTPVAGGGGDQAAGAVGAGIVKQGDAAISLGTSGVVFAPSLKPPTADGSAIHAFCHAVPNTWHTMSVMLAAGGSMQWLRNTLRFNNNSSLSYNDIDSLAEDAPAGSDGLFFLPYLYGERTPYNDPIARGAFIGLTLSHNAGHLCRAVMEGVAFGINDCVNLMIESGTRFRRIFVSGGGASSDLWCSILACVLDKTLKRLEVDQGPAMGAALLAGVGAKVWKDVNEATEKTLRVRDEIAPGKPQVKSYKKAYRRYCDLYPTLAPFFHK